MANGIYNEFKKELDTIAWVASTVKVLLVTNAYVLNIDAHSNLDDIDALGHEITGTGYIAGGTALTTKAIARDDVNDWSNYNADDAVWGTSTLTARGAIVYKDTGVASTSTLIAFVDFVTDKSSSGGDFTVQWHTDGVFRLA